SILASYARQGELAHLEGGSLPSREAIWEVASPKPSRAHRSHPRRTRSRGSAPASPRRTSTSPWSVASRTCRTRRPSRWRGDSPRRRASFPASRVALRRRWRSGSRATTRSPARRSSPCCRTRASATCRRCCSRRGDAGPRCWLALRRRCRRRRRSRSPVCPGDRPSEHSLGAPAEVERCRDAFHGGWLTPGYEAPRHRNSSRHALLRIPASTLEVGGGRHTSGRAHADDRAVTAATRELEQRGSEVSNAGHAIRVAERHRTTVDVRDLPRRLELRLVVERGHRVRLVKLPQIDIRHRELVMLHELPDRGRDRDAYRLVRDGGPPHA